MTTTEILKEAEGNMKKTVEVVKKEFASMRAGRATPSSVFLGLSTGASLLLPKLLPTK